MKLDAAIRNYVIFDKYEMDIGNIYKLVIGRSYPEQGVSPDGNGVMLIYVLLTAVLKIECIYKS